MLQRKHQCPRRHSNCPSDPPRVAPPAPPQARAAYRSSGSGVLIEKLGEGGGLVLTAAHVVANSTYMEIQLPGSPDKIPARVVSVAHETDLALIQVDSGFEGVEALSVASPDSVPRLRDKVFVLGYPVGGDELSITEGVVSRLEVRRGLSGSYGWRAQTLS